MDYISLFGREFYTKMHRFLVIKQKECKRGSSFLFFFFHWTQFNLKKCPMVKHIILPRKMYRWFLSVVYLYQNVLSRKDSVKPCRSHPFEGSCLSSGMCRCHHSREMGLFADPCLVRHQQ